MISVIFGCKTRLGKIKRIAVSVLCVVVNL
jgi:hypothetical protein